MGAWIMSGVTFQEAARKKILWTALVAGGGFLLIFGVGLHIQVDDFRTNAVSPFVRYQIVSAMLLVGLYTVDLLAVVMTALTSIDTVAGEISSGTIQAIATKPLARWQILIGKWIGFAGMVLLYVAIMFAGTLAEGYWIGGVMAEHPIQGLLLVFLECMIALSVTLLFGTWFSTLSSGVIVLGLLGFAFMGGWLEQMSGFTEGGRLAMVGIVSSVIMPSEAVWRRAAFEMQTPLAGSLQFSPFANISVPSAAMVGYAIVYLLAALGVALYHLSHRDL